MEAGHQAPADAGSISGLKHRPRRSPPWPKPMTFALRCRVKRPFAPMKRSSAYRRRRHLGLGEGHEDSLKNGLSGRAMNLERRDDGLGSLASGYPGGW
jgi:hypothetical protein